MRFPFAILLCLVIAPALATEPRKIDFTTVLTDADDLPIEECADATDKDCKVKRKLTLGMVAMRSLAVPDRDISPEESLKRGQLAISVYKSSGAQLTAEEVTSIKKAIAKSYSPLVVMRAVSILDPASAK